MTAPAFEHDGAPVARERFYAIACDPRRSVAVEACAGAGKTWMLVSRIVRALLAGAEPHQVLAITFTKKAAGEMRARLHQWLTEWATAPRDVLARALTERGVASPTAADIESLRGLHERVLRAGRPVQIRTFHSWFAALLRNAPLAVLQELGLPANHELLEQDDEAVARVWRRFHVAAARDAGARADYGACVAAYGRSQTRKALQACLARRVEFVFADAHGTLEPSVQPMAQVFERFAGCATPSEAMQLPGVRTPLLDAARALGRASAKSFAAKGVELEKALSAGDVDGVLAALLTEGKQRVFSEKVPDMARVRAAQDLALELAQAQCQHEAWLHHNRMVRLGRLLLAEFAALKREQGWVDMSDVERAAQVLLSDPVLSGWVQERLDQQVRHLLIDEFQDTNPLQWQALHAWLQAYAGAGDAPAIFLVGDPKQSIYRFRRAEPQVFAAAQHFIAELGGDRLSCDHTHRNAPAVLNAVNAVFTHAQEQGEFSGFRPHSTQSSEDGAVVSLPRLARDLVGGDAPMATEWRDSLTQPRELPEEKLLALECSQAADWVARELAGGVRPEEVMVLARTNVPLAVMEDELRARHIPSLLVEKSGLGEAPEVQDIIALLDALVTPTHDLSLAIALKSPLFSLGDDALVLLAQAQRQRAEGSPALPWFELLHAPGLPDALVGAGVQLARWKALVDALPPHDALQAIYASGDVLLRFAAAAPAPMRASVVANLRAVLGAALEVSGGRALTPYAFVRALKGSLIKRPAVASQGVVWLLTVHGAKGLEAPHVLLLNADPVPRTADTMSVLCEWPGEAPAPWRFAFVPSETRPPACCAEALAVEQAARLREELNGLYVAMTRAGRRIVLSSSEPARASPGSWWQRLAALAQPIPAVGPASPAFAAEDASAQSVSLLTVPSVRWSVAVEARVAATPASRFGEAVHRLLEHGVQAEGVFSAARLGAVAREFHLDVQQLAQAQAMALRILRGEGAWAWDVAAIDWQANEVDLVHGGEALRLDRLVRRSGSGEWWVLDYKSASHPERQPALLAQMARYRDAVAAAYPGAPVRAAFLTGDGRLVESA